MACNLNLDYLPNNHQDQDLAVCSIHLADLLVVPVDLLALWDLEVLVDLLALWDLEVLMAFLVGLTTLVDVILEDLGVHSNLFVDCQKIQ